MPSTAPATPSSPGSSACVPAAALNCCACSQACVASGCASSQAAKADGSSTCSGRADAASDAKPAGSGELVMDNTPERTTDMEGKARGSARHGAQQGVQLAAVQQPGEAGA